MRKKLVSIILMMAMVLCLGGCGGGSNDKNNIDTSDYSEFTWPDYGAATLLPEPSSNKGEIKKNIDDSFLADIAGVTHDGFNKYANDCLNKGFTINHTLSETRFGGATEEGYRLTVTYDEESNLMNISMYYSPIPSTESTSETN